VFVIRYRERIVHHDRDAAGRDVSRQEISDGVQVLPPRQLKIGGEARVESRSRGLYRARVFHLALQLTGSGSVPPNLGLGPDHSLVDGQAFLVVGISDPRGIDNDPDVSINGATRHFEAGALGLAIPSGVHLHLGPVDLADGGSYDFAFPLNLTGSERLSIAPAGDSTSVALRSDWPRAKSLRRASRRAGRSRTWRAASTGYCVWPMRRARRRCWTSPSSIRSTST
jgi:inner membrane protein